MSGENLGAAFVSVGLDLDKVTAQVVRELPEAFDAAPRAALRAAEAMETAFERGAAGTVAAADRAGDAIGTNITQGTQRAEEALQDFGRAGDSAMDRILREARDLERGLGSGMTAAGERAEGALVEVGNTGAAQLDRVEREAKDADNAIDSMGGKVSGLAGKLGGLLAVGAFVAIGQQAAEAATEVARVDALTASLLTAAGGASGQTSASIEELAGSLSELAAVDDDDIQASLNVLLRFRSIGPDTFEPAAAAVLDLAAGLGVEVPAAAQTLGRALEDPIAAISRLRRAGITFSDDQERMIRQLVATGDTAGAQAVVLEAVGDRFAGAAEAAATPLARMRVQIGELQEALGAGLLTGLEAAGAGFDEVFGGLEGILGQLGQTVGEVLAQVGPPVIQALGSVAELVVPLIGTVAEAFGILLPPVADFVSALSDELQPLVARLSPVIITLAEALGEVLAENLEEAIPSLVSLAESFVVIVEALEPLIQYVDEGIDLANFITGAPQALEALASIAEGVAGVAQGVSDFLTGTDGSKVLSKPFTDLADKGGEALSVFEDAVVDTMANVNAAVEELAADFPELVDAFYALDEGLLGSNDEMARFAILAGEAGLSAEQLELLASQLGLSAGDLSTFIQSVNDDIAALTSSIEGNLPRLSEMGTGLDAASEAFDLGDFHEDVLTAIQDIDNFLANLAQLPPNLQAAGAALGPAAAAAFAALPAEERAAMDATLGDLYGRLEGVPDFVAAQAGPMAQAAALAGEGLPAGMAVGASGTGAAAMGALSYAAAKVATFDMVSPGSKIGQELTAGVAAGIRKGEGSLVAQAGATVRRALDAAMAAAGISSPSKLFRDEVGLPIAQGIAAGIDLGQGEVNAATSRAIDAAVTFAKGGGRSLVSPNAGAASAAFAAVFGAGEDGPAPTLEGFIAEMARREANIRSFAGALSTILQRGGNTVAAIFGDLDPQAYATFAVEVSRDPAMLRQLEAAADSLQAADADLADILERGVFRGVDGAKPRAAGSAGGGAVTSALNKPRGPSVAVSSIFRSAKGGASLAGGGAGGEGVGGALLAALTDQLNELVALRMLAQEAATRDITEAQREAGADSAHLAQLLRMASFVQTVS